MLDSQIHLYCVDTGNFYSRKEERLHNTICRIRLEKNRLKQLAATDKYISIHQQIKDFIKHKDTLEKKKKELLSALLKNKTKQNMLAGRKSIRILNPDTIKDTQIISMFESSLTRMIGIDGNTLTTDLIVVQVYYFDIFKDLLFHGFLYNEEKYRYYTSSAGQLRTKKAVFIRESVWNSLEKTLMCGLTVDTINRKGGINANKYLAYLALANSATDVWNEFDIDKCIVIPDFETFVKGEYDFIDDKTYTISRQSQPVAITHTDGAGMVLPSLLEKNAMFRAPWIKGLLGVFDFAAFIREKHCSPIITDIYGQAHDVLAENIQIIFTKSQFKMHAYYQSWEEYRQYFKEFGCQAGLCNMEEDRIKNAKLNYQMLQTLTDITDEEIKSIAGKSISRISNLCSSQDAMMAALGITPYLIHPTDFQKAVKHYPALLNDVYVKDLLRDIKNSLLKKYRSGKLEITGKYTFILPDFYAACQFWFCDDKKPGGLLGSKEVYCRLMKYYEKLDCLRSPHLYREHAIRSNAAYDSQNTEHKKWFTTNALYTSSHDLISRLLQFDVDGDKSLVIGDAGFVQIAERNMKGIVPLYYHMKKSAPTQLTSHSIYQGLYSAFTGGNIGRYSNDIAKIWNSRIFLNGSKEEKQQAIDAVKLLCMENNFVIDFAKTLYKPERPQWANDQIRSLTKDKLPAFFTFAKDKESSQTEERSHSFVNRLYDLIPDTAINTRGLNLEEIDYRKLMKYPDIICPKEVSDLYNRLNPRYRYRFSHKDEQVDNLSYIMQDIREQFTQLGYSAEIIADMLVQYAYGRETKLRYKDLLWFCFGSYITEHIYRNIPDAPKRFVQCKDCGEWFEVNISNKRTCRCSLCSRIHRKNYQRDLMRKKRC